jgi:hypothetical protein
MEITVLETICMLYPGFAFTDCYLTDKTGNARGGICCKLYIACLTIGQHAAHLDGQLEAMNIALMQLCGAIRSFKKAYS